MCIGNGCFYSRLVLNTVCKFLRFKNVFVMIKDIFGVKYVKFI